MEPELSNTEVANTEIANLEITAPQIIQEVIEEEELHRHECGVCGYIYEPTIGDAKRNIPIGTAFERLPENWRCPVCNAPKKTFSDIGTVAKPSGFKENLGYGFGVNTLTPGQKNIIIFGSLALAVLFFLSFYAID